MMRSQGTEESRGQVMQNLVCHVRKNKNSNNTLPNDYCAPIYNYALLFHHNNYILKDIISILQTKKLRLG